MSIIKFGNMRGGNVINTAEVLRVLGEPMRLRILNILLSREVCVCDLETILDATQSNVSRHLGKLRAAGVITFRKEAQWIYYTVSPKFRTEHSGLLTYLQEQLEHDAQCQVDLAKVAELATLERCK